MNHFGKNARKLTRFENNRAKVDFLHCKNGHRDPAAILTSGDDLSVSRQLLQKHFKSAQKISEFSFSLCIYLGNVSRQLLQKHFESVQKISEFSFPCVFT